MISKILKSKRQNLIELNKNNQAVNLKKNYLNALQIMQLDECKNFFINSNTFEITINKNTFLNKINNLLSRCQTNVQIINVIKDNNIYIKDIESIDAQNGDQAFRNILIKKIIDDYSKKFDNLIKYFKEANKKYYDSGKWLLYLCYGLIETSVELKNNVNNVKAPLFCLPIGIKSNSATSFIVYKRISKPMVNQMARIHLKNLFGIDYSQNINIESEENFDQNLEIIKNNFLNSNLLPFSYFYPEKTKAEKSKLNKVDIMPCYYFTFIDAAGGKMLEDYDNILQSDYEFPEEKLMFTNQNLNNEVYEKDDILELNNQLNLVQKQAILASKKNNVLIYGPPGTGKSEVVVNLIANNMLDNNILVASEKKAALDVICDRLDILNDLAISTSSSDKDFYEKIVKLNSLILNAQPINPKFENQSYKKILYVINNINNFLKTSDIQAVEKIKKKIAILNDFDLKKHDFILNVFVERINKDKLDIDTFLDEIYTFNDIAKVFDKYYKINDSNVIYLKLDNLKRLQEFLLNIKDDGKKIKIIDLYFESGKIKAPILSKKITENQKVKLDDILNVLFIIKNYQQLKLLRGYSQIKEIFNYDKKIISSALYFLAFLKDNQSYLQLKETFSDGLLNDYVKEYWLDKDSKAKVSAKIIHDKYLYQVKQKLIQNLDLQEKWVEIVKKANLNKKVNLVKFISQYFSILKLVFPIWIMSPEDVSLYIPLNKNEFSLGIFDEASQITIERSLPLVYRCTRSIVSGDDKQLRPTSFFASNLNIDEDEITSDDELYNLESLLDKAKVSNWCNYTLSNHYRSVNEKLIAFSNKYIYDDKLLCITKNGWLDKQCIEVIEDKFVYDRQSNTNPDEAKVVLQLLNRNIQLYKKIVVITFNMKQAKLIENECYKNQFLANALEADYLRIRSIEEVQGDEADLVILSTTFGKDSQGKFIQNFGPIAKEGGKNRINVMVTRAKEKMVIVKSFRSEDITTENENTYILKMFFNYIENIANQNQNVNLAFNYDSSILSKNIFDLITNVHNDKFAIKTNFKIGSHNFDLALFENDKLKYLIILDSINKIKSFNNENWLKSFDYQKYFIDRGYNILRFNELEYCLNANKIINKIKSL